MKLHIARLHPMGFDGGLWREKKSEPIRTPTENFSVEVLFWGYVGPMLCNVWGSMEVSRGKKIELKTSQLRFLLGHSFPGRDFCNLILGQSQFLIESS